MGISTCQPGLGRSSDSAPRPSWACTSSAPLETGLRDLISSLVRCPWFARPSSPSYLHLVSSSPRAPATANANRRTRDGIPIRPLLYLLQTHHRLGGRETGEAEEQGAQVQQTQLAVDCRRRSRTLGGEELRQTGAKERRHYGHNATGTKVVILVSATTGQFYGKR